jgi:hypothetical protein
LGQGPKDADQCCGKGGDADGFVDGKELGFGGKLLSRRVGHAIGDKAKGYGGEDQKGGQPVQGAGD